VTEVLPASPEAVERAARLLQKGQVVAIPTETVYGLAGAAFNEVALTRIFEVKERPTFDPLIVHVAAPLREEGTGGTAGGGGAPARGGAPAPATIFSGGRAPTPTGTSRLLADLGLLDHEALGPTGCAVLDRLAEAFWPGPITLVIPKQPGVPDLATSGLSTVAVRMPAHPVAQAVIRAAGVPLAAPSANRFGRISPTTAAHVLDELGGRIPLILDAGPCEVGVESTVLELRPDGSTRVLRPGGTPVEAIGALLGAAPASGPHPAPGLDPAFVADAATGPDPVSPGGRRGADPGPGAPAASPGLLASHYAPKRPLLLLPDALDNVKDEELISLLGCLDDVKDAPGEPAEGDPVAGDPVASHPAAGDPASPTRPDAANDGIGLLLQRGDSAESLRAARRVEALAGRPVRAVTLSPTGALDEAARRLFASLRELDRLEGVGVILAEPPRSRTGLAQAIADRLKRAAAGRGEPG
jgi:L-threonylcarbamoyladenylate synthase